jgi:hypothetical protein
VLRALPPAGGRGSVRNRELDAKVCRPAREGFVEGPVEDVGHADGLLRELGVLDLGHPNLLR